MTEANTTYTAIPNDYLSDLVDLLLAKGMTKAAEEIADMMEGDE